MILFTVLLIMALIGIIMTIIMGVGGIFIFGDLIICLLLIGTMIRLILKKWNKS